MTDRDDEKVTRILAPRDHGAAGVQATLHRRAAPWPLFSGSVLLAACSGDSDANPSAGGAPTGSTGTGEVEDQLNFYHWAEYDDPKLFKRSPTSSAPPRRSTSTPRTRRRSPSSTPRSGTARLRHRGARPASTSRRWCSRTCSPSSTWRSIPNFANLETPVHEPALGPEQRVLGVQGLGLDRLDLRHRGDRRRRSPPGTTSSTRRKGAASGKIVGARRARPT